MSSNTRRHLREVTGQAAALQHSRGHILPQQGQPAPPNDLTPWFNPKSYSLPGCPAWGRAGSKFRGCVAPLTDGQRVQTLLKGKLAMPRGWCRPSIPASTSSRLRPATSAGPGVGGDTSWSCCLWREKKPLGSALSFTPSLAQRLVGFRKVWRRRCGVSKGVWCPPSFTPHAPCCQLAGEQPKP